MTMESGLEPPLITNMDAKLGAESLITKEWVILSESWKELDINPWDRWSIILTAQPGPYPCAELYKLGSVIIILRENIPVYCMFAMNLSND